MDQQTADALRTIAYLQEAMIPLQIFDGVGLAARIGMTWIPIQRITPERAHEYLLWNSVPLWKGWQ